MDVVMLLRIQVSPQQQKVSRWDSFVSADLQIKRNTIATN